jgi:hypothetical protein
MSSNVKTACLLLSLLGGASQHAYGVMCYQVLDRDNSAIYSATEPPFSMAGREFDEGQRQLQASGRYLVWFDTPTCAIQSARPVTIVMGPGDTVARTSADAAALGSSGPAPRTRTVRGSPGARAPRADRG